MTALQNFSLPSVAVVLKRDDAKVLCRRLLRTRRCSEFCVGLKACRNSFTHRRMDYPFFFHESLNGPFYSCGSVTRLMNGSEAAGLLRIFSVSRKCSNIHVVFCSRVRGKTPDVGRSNVPGRGWLNYIYFLYCVNLADKKFF